MMLFMDSNDADYGHGAGHKQYYDWRMNATNNYFQMVPNRHRGGGNMVFLDGHVEYKKESFFLEVTNQPQWLISSNVDDPRVWTESEFGD
jgi:prepilin-type processing-associated H-X9-DG protein